MDSKDELKQIVEKAYIAGFEYCWEDVKYTLTYQGNTFVWNELMLPYFALNKDFARALNYSFQELGEALQNGKTLLQFLKDKTSIS